MIDSWRFPKLQWVREMLVSLGEYEFKQVPTDVRRACQEKFSGFTQTIICEDAMQLIEATGHEPKSHTISRKTRWRRLQLSNLIPKYDKKHIEVTAQAEIESATVLPAAVFKATKREFSIGSEKLRGISDAGWTSPSPQTIDEAPMSLMCLKHFEGDWGKVKECWLSRLVPPGFLVFRHGSGKWV